MSEFGTQYIPVFTVYCW